MPSPTFSLLTGQWLDFHQLADYHASRTAAGQAVIVSPHAGVANELVCHGENGYVLELDLALWVKHAADLLGNEALLEQFSKDSMLKVQAYTYDAAAKGIIDAVFAATVF